ALTHSATYEESQHQLFHLSLISNVTEQLTSALDMVSHLPRVGRPEERSVPETVETASLSARELEVLRLISSGYANKEIAQRLFLTESTVELHASRIRKKLKLKSRTALVKYACDKGIV
ncbi:MAG TPA: response regulator transcription factor, partial [Candidatus Obscuribacter sp.]|nr:response regulator transcription factor [Candidatus Obscuribacter sp.]